MRLARIVPAGPVEGRVHAPSSKSYTHRALVAGHLADRATEIREPLACDDTLRTARALRVLGSRVRLGRHAWTIVPGSAPRPGTPRTIDCGESGTTLRFVVALAALQATPFRFIGRGRLPQRPMGPLLTQLEQLGASVRTGGAGRALPLRLRGPVHGGTARLEASQSSQFVSALLFALPTVRPDSLLLLRGRPVSEPYVRASLAVLADRGVRVGAVPRGYALPGGQRFRGGRVAIPGDASSAAYLWAAAAVSRGSVEVDGIPGSWPQADLGILELLTRYGASVRRSGARVRVSGSERRPFRFDLDDAPDLFPLAGVLAATAAGRSVLTGAAHASAKESDRRSETARLVRALGGRARLSDRRLVVEGRSSPRPVRHFTSQDHRLVMSAAVGALATEGTSVLGDAGSVDKSFPSFFRVLEGLGGRVASS